MNSIRHAYVTHTGGEMVQVPEKGKDKAVKFQDHYVIRY